MSERADGSLMRRGVFAGLTLAVLASPALAQSPPAAAPAGPPAVPVTVTVVSRKDVPILLRNIGAVQAMQVALMRSRVDGTLEKVFFQEGQEVKRGDPLALIDPRPYQAALDQASAKRAQDEAQLANAKLDLARSVELARTQSTPQQTVDTRAAAVRVLEATLKADDALIAAARVNLDYTTITAPFDGTMGLRLIDPGNVVRAADTTGVGIVTIAQTRPLTVVFNLPQDGLPAIRAGMAAGKLPVTAHSADDRQLLGTGELITIDNTIDVATGTIKLKARFENADSKLWPGQFVNARLQTEVQKGVLVIPSIAVQRGPANLFVYTVKADNTAAVTPVKVGQDDGQVAIVTSGLEDGMQVVVNGQSRLQNGARVVPTQAKPAS
jgi:multidrug efflux system membrane fusion protein